MVYGIIGLINFAHGEVFMVGAYGGLVYCLPVFGGMLADRWLGMRKAVIFGGLLLVCGHFGMAFEGDAATVVNGVVVRDEADLGAAVAIERAEDLTLHLEALAGCLDHEIDGRHVALLRGARDRRARPGIREVGRERHHLAGLVDDLAGDEARDEAQDNPPDDRHNTLSC